MLVISVVLSFPERLYSVKTTETETKCVRDLMHEYHS
jgi:hypothetical protein